MEEGEMGLLGLGTSWKKADFGDCELGWGPWPDAAGFLRELATAAPGGRDSIPFLRRTFSPDLSFRRTGLRRPLRATAAAP